MSKETKTIFDEFVNSRIPKHVQDKPLNDTAEDEIKSGLLYQINPSEIMQSFDITSPYVVKPVSCLRLATPRINDELVTSLIYLLFNSKDYQSLLKDFENYCETRTQQALDKLADGVFEHVQDILQNPTPNLSLLLLRSLDPFVLEKKLVEHLACIYLYQRGSRLKFHLDVISALDRVDNSKLGTKDFIKQCTLKI